MKKKLLLTLVLAGLCSASVYAEDYTKNDLRTKFLNNEAIIYEINIRTFNADDKDGNGLVEIEKGEIRGNFINAVDRLDELQKYGINAIHLMPINPVGKTHAIGTAGSVYAMTEIAGIDENILDKNSKLSAKDQLKYFVEECHKRGIRVFADIPACGSADFAKKNPEMFVTDKDGKAIIPVDWTDVRLLKTVEKDGSLNKKLLDEHKKYVDMLMYAGVDGIRADVAPIKPKEFWTELINYAREKDNEFMFLAETAEAWAPPKVPSPTADYKKLLEAGFDGYYGNCLNFLNFKSAKDFEFIFEHINKLAKKGIKKSVIGCFDSHDLKSAYITSQNYAESIMYMNATLPLNPYYVDGFQSGDKYDYPYSDKEAAVTYTDSKITHTHPNQIDIFNYSRKPGGSLTEMEDELKAAIALRKKLGKLVTEGSFKMMNTSDKQVFAYERRLGNEGLIVAVNTNHEEIKAFTIDVDHFRRIDIFSVLHNKTAVLSIKKGKIYIKLKPDKCVVIKYKLKDNKKK